ncbi:YidC/Oxa1 family membrane protein insertase [Tengunoibacter tsumagoiensis]|uniref:Membrane insertase YidC/Oxa/ALB C-terminal domain-containing protein n=1 Tax=Tengunoibacter tsumagoiensis TaxID=2014871 RepID=A0A401ZW49_9CHLR|nr:YidC/Oxa1 family membrane protein insertase [Tengunoibacter tsumagoiensis]GCE11026.1 hypothetical protein KTT_08850 [Tengunoibacter tsumagoiensis]
MGEIGYLFNLIFTFPIFNGLVLLFHLFGDFGLSIVVLTLIIKLILFPLTIQQLKSMKANQAIQPKMQEIKKKYANDQQAQMLAMQTLYKEAGINPAAGCLPLLIQMPVLYGLYFAFNQIVRATDHSSKGVHALNDVLYPFVPHFTTFPNIDLDWFSWLAPIMNPLLHQHWAWAISLGSPDPTHILPVIAGLATFIQLRMSQPKQTAPAPANAASDPTAQTMKTMQFIMPLFTVFIGWTFPAGLALYWTVSSIFQASQQYFVTGWGSLLVTPKVKPEQKTSSKVVESTAVVKNDVRTAQVVEDEDEDEGPIAKNLRPTPLPSTNGNGQSSYNRRPRGGSASARRRSGRR